jgi:pimeloyl-ACP methyl ester carboxylesterase
MPILTSDDGNVSYEISGSGPIALLIHCSPGNAQSWAGISERLSDWFQVIAPDLPGYGDTSPQPTGEEPSVGYASALIETVIRHVGAPSVMAGHSYGGVVALAVALRGNVKVGALALFEPVALQMLRMAGDMESFDKAKVALDEYITSFEGGNHNAVQKMVDLWFGNGAFARMPEPFTSYLRKATASNIRDVRATFQESYTPDAFRRLRMPVVTVVGECSPDITHRIAHTIAAHVPSCTIKKLEKADHGLISTHLDAVAQTIADIAEHNAQQGG